MELSAEEYQNQIFNQDVLTILRRLPDHSLDMIYGDPDYGVGVNYSGKKYITHWEQYIQWYIELTREAMRVLKFDGNLFMMNYPKQNAHLRVKFLDEHAHDVQDYAWVYNTNIGHTQRRFTTAHRSILHATKSKNNKFYKNNVAEPYQNPTDKRIRKRIADGHKGRMPYSWFYYDLVKNVSQDKTFHACQIPLDLVEMLIKASTQQQDTCFILFGGSGSEIMRCQELNRNFISCEIHPEYYRMICDRLNDAGVAGKQYRLDLMRRKAKYQRENLSLHSN